MLILTFSFSTISFLSHQVFIGNVDTSSVVQNKLKMPQITRWIRIVPRSWNNHIGMRVELYGCWVYHRWVLSLMSRMLKNDLLNINREYESGNVPRSWMSNLIGYKNRLGCLFSCEDHFHFHIFIRSSKYQSFHIFPFMSLVGNLRKCVFERLTSTGSESFSL